MSTLFHELAHQVLYIKDDTGFNESFATAAEEIGIEKWLAANGRQEDMTRYRAQKEQHRRFVELVSAAKLDLADYYGRDIEPDAMRDLKSARLEQLSSDVRAELKAAGRNVNHWLTGDINNARLLPMSLYDGQVPAFLALYAECESDLGCLYAEAEKLAGLDRDKRDARLAELAARYRGSDDA